MKKVISQIFALALICVFACTSLVACSGEKETQTVSAGQTTKVTIGTLATEDILPYWVAESEGLFAKHNLDAEIVVFQSATELIAAISSNQVDFAMTDPMVTASLYASGSDVEIKWITLGASADQGRFGIITADPSITSLSDLAGKGIGVGSNTILEYVMDTLMLDAGVPANEIVKEEIQKLPVRYESVANGQVTAAALPASLLALGEANGLHVVADDTQGENISQSVMIARSASLQDNADLLSNMQAAWDEAVALINANPENYRELLVEKANLPGPIAETYPISTYPSCMLPTQDMIDPVLNWMVEKGYLTSTISYDANTGCFSGR